MKTIYLVIAVAVAQLVLLSSTPVMAKEKDKVKEQSDGCAITIYLDANFSARKKGAAKKINEIHREQEARGYRILDMDIYTENGDMEGFFLTYIKASGC